MHEDNYLVPGASSISLNLDTTGATPFRGNYVQIGANNFPQTVDANMYANISPTTLAAIRAIVHDELQSMVSEIAREVGKELARQMRMETGAERR